jgi:hypothetical protein
MRSTPTSHARRPHPIDQLISPALRTRLAELDPLLNLDRLARLIIKERSQRHSAGVA